MSDNTEGRLGYMIRKAEAHDLDAVTGLYDAIHQAEAEGRLCVGWEKDVYPVRATAQAALVRGDLFVMERHGRIVGSGIINQIQVDVYEGAPWRHTADADQVCVLHTLVIDPVCRGQGLGQAFAAYYEEYARARGWRELRIDTNARNTAARALYRKRGYTEIGIVPTVFNGIPGVQLVLLEKWLGETALCGATRSTCMPAVSDRKCDNSDSFHGKSTES